MGHPSSSGPNHTSAKLEFSSIGRPRNREAGQWIVSLAEWWAVGVYISTVAALLIFVMIAAWRHLVRMLPKAWPMMRRVLRHARQM
jgi:hypothetical protein